MPALLPTPTSYGHEGRRKRALKRYYKLRDERQKGYDPMWRDISDFIAPGYGRFFCEDLNEGGRKNMSILDNAAERAAQSLAAVVMAYSTSPARAWFSLTTVDPELSEYEPVKLWLNDSTRRMQRVFARSNTYPALHQNYEEMVAFGNACSIVVPDYDAVIHLHPITAGQYVWAQDYQGRINTIFREFPMTVGQVVAEFGFDKCSISLQNRFNNGDLDGQVTIVHVIEPRTQRDPSYRDNLNMPWKSCYFEMGSTKRGVPTSQDELADAYLRESGFEQFPVLTGRWRVIGGDTYARGPGVTALGDAKSLQHLQQRYGLCVDIQTDPPLQVPMALQNTPVDGLPGGRTPTDGVGIRSLYENRLELSHLLESIRDTRMRIDKTFYVDMFLMLANGDDTQKTAREIIERHEEKLMMLGPVQQRMETEIQKPLIKLTLGYMIDAGVLLPPPPELLEAGAELNVEFLSVFSQAQRAVGMHTSDRFINTIGALTAIRQDVTDIVNTDRLARGYGEDLGIDPRVFNSDDEVKQIRVARANAQAAMAQSEAMAQQAKTTRDLAASPTGERNALTDILGNLQGYVSPSPDV